MSQLSFRSGTHYIQIGVLLLESTFLFVCYDVKKSFSFIYYYRVVVSLHIKVFK